MAESLTSTYLWGITYIFLVMLQMFQIAITMEVEVC